MKPVVAIVGRPNVGKSTLFNRITKSQDALVDNLPGVTRDRNYKDAFWNDVEFTLVDTGGYLSQDVDDFAGEIRFQVNQAIDSADAVVMVLDRKAGPSPFDSELIHMLRGVKKPVFYVVNKVDGPAQEEELYDFYRLGIKHAYPVSASHGYGVSDFLDDLTESLPKQEPEASMDFINIAVVGRPNVGKSSLINRILGQQRLVVSNIAGTTRDAVDTVYQEDNQSYLFIDTAGIRRKGRVHRKLEKFSVIKAIKGLERCHVALIVLDASEGVTEQDLTIAGYAHERGCGCILVFNKWDLVEKDLMTAKKYQEDLRYAARFMSYAPILTISSLTGRRVKKIFPTALEIYEQYNRRIGTGQFNRILMDAVKANEPSLVRGRRIKFYYGTQVSSAPPTFVCFVNYPKEVHFSYMRYLTNQVRLATGLNRTPIRLFLRQRTGSLDDFNFGNKRTSKKRRSKNR
ncbi:MAG: ribosome biogenesis GTPase Der [Desulfobacterales bacterium]